MKKILHLSFIVFLLSSVEIFAQAPCTPTVGITGATADYIDNFTFGTLVNNNSGDNPSDYALYPQTGFYTQGQSYAFSIQTGSPTWGQGLGMWIDYDGNGSFADPGEFVWASPTSNNTNANILTGNITIPLAAVPGVRRLRVCCWFANLVAQANACSIAGFGEYEDYNITIVANTPCTGTPTAGTAVGSPANPCPGVNVNYSLNGASLLGGLAYQWLRSTVGINGPWTVIAGATNATHTEVPPAGTSYYRCIVTCTNPGGGFDTSIAYTNVVQAWSPTSPCYCQSGAQNNTDQVITNVNIGSLNNTTDCVNPLIGTQGTGTGTPNQFADFTGSVPAPVVYTGLAQSLSLGVGTCGGSVATSAAIYIDYDHNASFNDPGEQVYSNVNIPTVPATVTGTFTPPIAALTGVTRMRVIIQSTWIGAINPCGPYAYGETEDYLINIVPPSPHDPAVTAISGAAGNCYTANTNMVVTLTNYGSSSINCGTNPITCTLHVNGPLGVTQYTATLSNPAITLNPFGANTAALLIPGVNLYAGGTYYMNTTLTIGNAGGVVNGNLFNDSLPNPIVRVNYRPTAGPDFQVCQGSPVLFGQGLTASGCTAPLTDSIEITFNVTPTADNVGATTTGTSQTVPGAACANQFAGNFANALLPALPAGAYFTQPGTLTVTNLSSSFPTECRFIIYSGTPVAPTLYSPCPQGYNVGANNINIGGAVIGGAGNFNVVRNISINDLGLLFANPPNTVVNIGYFETWNDNQNTSDIGVNAGGGNTTVKLKLYYQYVPTSFNWFTVPTGGGSISNAMPFNPVGVPGSGIPNTNTPGTTPFFAACSTSPNCRIPVNFIINPQPVALQDTLSLCENPVGSNGATFDLTTMDGPVSAFNPNVTVEYYGDQGLFYLLPSPNAYLTNTSFIYTKVIDPAGCFSTDTLMLEVIPQPYFPGNILVGSVCAPASIDVANLIDPFTTVPPGSDTLYYSDAACTIPHPNPHNITITDTVYIVIATNTTPVCADTAVAYIDISTAGTLIANQDILNYSLPGTVGPLAFNLTDGNTDTLFNPADCKRVVHITDIANGTSLGATQVTEYIDGSTQFHNGQPYVNRHYKIEPTTQTSATVCLYYLDDDFSLYNTDAFLTGWPQINPSTNLAISKVDNGDITDPGHTAIAIPNTDLTTSYDPATTVWTICFNVDSFSYFYAHAQNPFNVPLPVQLLTFTGKKIDGTSELQWATSSEQNCSHFVLQRSKDGKTFSDISNNIASKSINGNSSITLDYNYTDRNPLPGINYYRLQQHDLDGNKSYSKVIEVNHGSESTVKLYPNPVNTKLNIEINVPKAGIASIKVMDATGRVVRMAELKLVMGSNITDIPMEGLADGMYMIKVSNNSGLNHSQTIRKN